MDNDRTLWVTGAGSGMGRAVAVSAARRGYRVALSGRRPEALAETARLAAPSDAGSILELPLDVRDQDALGEAHTEIGRRWGTVTDVVLAAGLNSPRRRWADQDLATFSEIVDTNLLASARVASLVLPGMRSKGGGHLIFISSYAGWQHHPSAGVAYSASKTALASLVRTLNNEEKTHGIRACHLCPGDVDTDFLARRPAVPDDAARRRMLTAEDIARAVQFVLDSPAHVCVDELVISPTSQR